VLAEQLLGEWLHAVLVRDAAAVEAIRRWHEQAQPGPLVLLPSVPGPRLAADGHPLKDDLRVDGPAAAWVRALLAGHEVLEGGEKGGARCDGLTVRCSWRTHGGGRGPLERRAELEALAQEVRERRRAGAAPRRRWSARSPSSQRPRPRSRQRAPRRSGSASRSSKRAR